MKGIQFRRDAERLYDRAIEYFEKEDTLEGTKSEFIERMGNILQMDGMKAEKISVKLNKLFGYYVAPRTIRHVCSKHGWTDKRFSNGGEDGENNGEGGNDAALDGSDSLNTFFERAAETVPYYDIRYPYMQFFQRLMKLTKNCMEELVKDYDVEVADDGKVTRTVRRYDLLFESQKDKIEYFVTIANVFYNMEPVAKKCLDSRQAVLPYMLLPFVAMVGSTTIKNFSQNYFARVKAKTEITTKKTTQFIKAMEAREDLLNVVKEEAFLWESIDLKCPDCKKAGITAFLKTSMNPMTGTWDFVCKNWEGPHEENRHFPFTMLGTRLNVLARNTGRAGDRFLIERGLATAEELRD